jgi:hypothetical protein
MSLLSESIKSLLESPLPDDWDHDVYSPRSSFAEKVRYATQMAQKVGTGSSRVAFVIDYQGRKTVLKIAKNNKGLVQNSIESQTFGDWMIQKLGLFIPMIDYDEKNNRPFWIHTEFAEKATAAHIKNACGGSLNDLVAYAQEFHGMRRTAWGGDSSKIIPESELAEDFVDYVGNYSPELGDYTRLANWGIYKGRPVIIDAGFNEETKMLYIR